MKISPVEDEFLHAEGQPYIDRQEDGRRDETKSFLQICERA
jgi:hypothetical protein